jgi:signal transduction histidine kinase
MVLHDFLEKHKKEILLLSEQKTLILAGLLGGSEQLKLGLPLFYEQLIKVLEKKLSSNPPEELLIAAAEHGKEFLRLGYTLSHVVHAYGAMCQAITELATIKNANISPYEFNILNGCLDVAIAAAVSEFQFRSVEASEAREVQHLGFLAHELRNSLSSATLAQDMIKAGLVGTSGSTAAVLEANLSRMRHLIDRSLSEVRMRAEVDIFVVKFHLSILIDQILITAKLDADKKKQSLHCDVDLGIEIENDRQFLLSAIGNLVQNAIKYSKVGAKIWLRGKTSGDRVLIVIEDECGGLDPDKIDTLFEPYEQANKDRSGLGLGLAVTQRAVDLCQGKITVHNKPGYGCAMTIDIPFKIESDPSLKTTVSGINSVQPNFQKKS